jgi:tRNA threonylcarbamoyladenosine biosynthesis protein TsaE
MMIDYSIGEIHQTALKFIELIDGKKVIAFHGPMGSGKTTFIHASVMKRKLPVR